jgi:hypothetical protein
LLGSFEHDLPGRAHLRLRKLEVFDVRAKGLLTCPVTVVAAVMI